MIGKNSAPRHSMGKSSATKGVYWIMFFSLTGASTLPVFFKVLFTQKESFGTVNGIPIELTEYRFALTKEQRLLEAYRAQLGNYYQRALASLGRSERAEETVIEQLVIEKLLLGLAQRIPLELSEGFVKHELTKPRVLTAVLGEVIPQYLVTEQGGLRVDVLSKYLQHQGLTLGFFEGLVENLLKEQLIMIFAQSSAIVSRSDIAALLASRFSSRTFQVETIPLAPFLKETESRPVTDAELLAFYEGENRTNARYWSPERRTGEVWVFELHRDKEAGEKAQQQFLAEAEQVIQQGSDHKGFRSFLEDRQGKKRSLKRVQRNDEVGIKALFSLAQVGELGVAAQKGRGYIVKLQEITTREQVPLEQIRDEVTGDLRRHWAEGLALEALSHSSSSKKQELKLPAGVSSDAALTKLDIAEKVVQKLIVVGDQEQGVAKESAYRIRLESVSAPDEKMITEQGGVRKLEQQLWEQQVATVGRNFIASLREHAILSVRQLTEQQDSF